MNSSSLLLRILYHSTFVTICDLQRSVGAAPASSMTALLDLQGNRPDVPMDDLAKGQQHCLYINLTSIR